jgi:dihydrofolate reductase
MAKLFVQMSVSLDGYIEDGDGNMDWFAGDPAFDEVLTTTLRGIGGMVFGRRAHALGATYWPTAADGTETVEVAEQIALMNSLPKYVLTHGKEEPGWPNSHAVAIEELTRLKAEARKPIALFAGARAAQAALASAQVDELRLIHYPVVLGGGTALFAADGQRRPTTLLESQTYASGPTLRRYALN